MRARRSRVALVSCVAALVAAGASRPRAEAKAGAKVAAAPDAPAVDVAAVKNRLEILTDGKQHYVALIPFDDGGWTHVYYGDGKTFHALRVIGSGANDHESFDLTFWEPRAKVR